MAENENVSKSIADFIEVSLHPDSTGNAGFDVESIERQEQVIHEDDEIRLLLILTKAQRRNTSRWVYSHIEFKNFDDVSKSGGGFRVVDFEIPLIQQMLNSSQTLNHLIMLAFHSCSIKNYKNIEFETNDYKLEIVKISTKYVTISEHINAVRFEKRFANIDLMFQYIMFRKYFHQNVNIEVSVSPQELEKLNIEKRVLTKNVERIYDELMERLTTNLHNAKVGRAFSITNIYKTDLGLVNFDVTMKQDNIVVQTLHVTYSDIAGVSIGAIAQLDDTIDSNSIITTACLYTVISRIETNSGYFKRYVELEMQLKKFCIKTAKSGNNDTIAQVPVYELASSLSAKLRQAKDDMDMITEKIDLTPVGKYSRWVQLEGTMKNRRKCAMIIYASDGGQPIEEYRLEVEKERISDDTTEFFSSYFA